MGMKIAVVWAGFTGYTGFCWRELAKRHQVRIYIEPSEYEQRFDGLELDGLDWRRVEREDIGAAVDDIAAFGPDAMLVCGWSTPLVLAAAKARVGACKILAFDMPWETSLRKIAARWLLWPKLRHFDGAFVPGKRTLRYAEWLGFGGRMATGLNPSGWDRFKDVIPAESGFVYVGRFSGEKGLGALFEAYGKYRRRVEEPWALEIVGSGDVAVPDMEGVVRTGFVPPVELKGVLSRNAALVLPSLWEPWGVSAMEAMSAGLITVASDACGFTDDVEPTAKVAAGDAEALCGAMVKVHRMTAEGRRAAGARGRAQAKEYSAEKWVERFESLVERVSRRRGNVRGMA